MSEEISARVMTVEREDIMPRMKFFLNRAGVSGRIDSVPPEFYALSHETYKRGMELADPFACELFLPACLVAHELIPRTLEGAAAYSFLAFTIGHEIDRTIDRLMKDSPLAAVYLDAWGSESVENLADRVDERLRLLHGDGSIRFAPGYGDFDVRKNIKILEMIGIAPINALATGLLEPRKSIVCIIGWKDDIK